MSTNSVNPLSAAATQAANAQASSIVPANMQISESDFLQLITTQMQDQDPLNPSDPTQFLSQVEGLSEVSSLQNVQTTLQGQQLTEGAALIGQSVLVPVSTAALATGGTVTGAIQAPTGTTNLTVSVSDASGEPVSTFQVTPQSSGLTSFSWNGESSGGTAAPAGTYGFSVTATVDGATQPVDPLILSQVSSVTVDPTTQGLDVTTNNGTVPFSSIASVL